MEDHAQKKAGIIIRWIARVYGTVVLAIPLIFLIQVANGRAHYFDDWRTIVLYVGLIGGLSIAYKWELAGGIFVTLGILISGFIHPIIIPPGILYIVSWFILHTSKKRTVAT